MSAYNPVKARERLLKRYGLTPPDYARLLLAQGGKCRICLRAPSGKRMLDIDHCHQSMEIRGLLCHRCNRGLGYFRPIDGYAIFDYLDPTTWTGYFVPKKKRRR